MKGELNCSLFILHPSAFILFLELALGRGRLPYQLSQSAGIRLSGCRRTFSRPFKDIPVCAAVGGAHFAGCEDETMKRPARLLSFALCLSTLAPAAGAQTAAPAAQKKPAAKKPAS